MTTNSGMCLSRGWCRDIVVLADRDRDALDADVARTLQGSGLHFKTRSGAPYSAKVSWWWP